MATTVVDSISLVITVGITALATFATGGLLTGASAELASVGAFSFKASLSALFTGVQTFLVSSLTYAATRFISATTIEPNIA